MGAQNGARSLQGGARFLLNAARSHFRLAAGVAVVAVAPPAYAAAQPMRGPIAVTAVPMPAQPAAVVTVTATPQSPEAVI